MAQLQILLNFYHLLIIALNKRNLFPFLTLSNSQRVALNQILHKAAKSPASIYEITSLMESTMQRAHFIKHLFMSTNRTPSAQFEDSFLMHILQRSP